MLLQQYQTTLTELTANPPMGRVSIRISANSTAGGTRLRISMFERETR